MMRWLALITLTGTLAVVAFIYLARPGARTSDGLDYVPGDAAAFVTFRFSELWDSPLGAKTNSHFGKEMNKALQGVAGLALADVERVTVVLPKVSARGETRDFWTIVKTKKEYDRERIRSSFSADVIDQSHNGKTFSAGPDGAIYFLSGDLLVFGTKTGIRDFLDRPKGQAGVFGSSITAAETNSVVLAVRDPWTKADSFGYEILPWPKMNALASAPLAVLTVNVIDQDIVFGVRVDLTDEAEAEKVEVALHDLTKMRTGSWFDLAVTRSKLTVALTGKEPIVEARSKDVLFRGEQFAVHKRYAMVENAIATNLVNTLTFRGTYIGCNFPKPKEAFTQDWSRLATSY